MSFATYDVSLELVRVLANVVPAIKKHDRDLADQLKRAATSVVLNVNEGRRRAVATNAGRSRSRTGALTKCSRRSTPRSRGAGSMTSQSRASCSIDCSRCSGGSPTEKRDAPPA